MIQKFTKARSSFLQAIFSVERKIIIVTSFQALTHLTQRLV